MRCLLDMPAKSIKFDSETHPPKLLDQLRELKGQSGYPCPRTPCAAPLIMMPPIRDLSWFVLPQGRFACLARPVMWLDSIRALLA